MKVVHICPNRCSKYTAEIMDRKNRKDLRIMVEDICPVCGSVMERAIYPDTDVNITIYRKKIDL